MDINAVDPDDLATVTAAVELYNAALDTDCPAAIRDTPGAYAGYLRHGWDGEPPAVFAGSDADGRLIGLVDVETTTWDNTHLAWLSVLVHPQLRRRGHGTELLAFAERRAAELGRRSVGMSGYDAEASRGFAASHGYEQKAVEVQRRQVLADVDPASIDVLHVEAAQAATDYDLLRLTGHTPAELLGAVAEMTGAINDAPTDELDVEDEVFPAERVDAYETATLARGKRLYRVVARHRESGELAGHTVAVVEIERPEIGFQNDTSVVREHRGHRLGLLLKTDMLRWLREAEPRLASLDTWNAESNDHMIGVNERLGYRVVARTLDFQRDLTPDRSSRE
ncbi:MAG TPA: GNAT family N-acetyltransferase [Jiangellaceae bacterium]